MKLLSFLILLCLWVSTVYAGDYRGDLKSYQDFIHQYDLDWPVPKQIGYFEPIKGQGLIRYAHWVPDNTHNAKADKVVVHFSGRTEFIEKGIYAYKDFLQQGYEVWTLDWRGQGFSVRSLEAKQKHHIESFNQYLEDAIYFIDRLVQLPKYAGTKVLLSHSMGGSIALQYLLNNPNNLFDLSVLASPMIKIRGDAMWMRTAVNMQTMVAAQACAISTRYAWSSDFEKDKACNLVNADKVTEADLLDVNKTITYANDFNKSAIIDCLVESSINSNGEDKPDLRIGCPTAGWINAAFDAIDFNLASVNKLNTPTLIITPAVDTMVDVSAQKEFCNLSDYCQLQIMPSLDGLQPGHELLVETDNFRQYLIDTVNSYIQNQP